MSHPFWKTRFSLDDPAYLRSIQGSGVPACWIDSALGLDVAAPEPCRDPHGLEADAISTVVRRGALCDVYDVVTSNRPY